MKIIIAEDIYKLLQDKDSLLNRKDIIVLPTGSNDETLELHLAHKVNLIITELDMPGMTSELLFSRIRKSTELRQVSVLMISPNNMKSIERCARCMADAVITGPVNPTLILAKTQDLLDLSWRKTSRMRISVNGKVSVRGNPVDTTHMCCFHDISSTGLLLETGLILNCGDKAVCSFFLPNGTHVEAEGEIVRTVYPTARSAANQYGVRFSNRAAEARQTLETFFKSYV